MAVAHTLFATGSTWQLRPDVFTYYQALGDAFLAGQLHLLTPPDPNLLALADPYDPAQNSRTNRLHDASLYNGRYYVYWGPVPALIHALWRLLTSQSLDVRAVMIGSGVCASFGFWLILDRLRRHYAPGAAGWVVWGSSLAFALGGITPYILGRPGIYHEAVLGAVGFILPSWLAFLQGHESGAHRRGWLVVSGVLLGLAIATRITYLGYAVGPGLVLAWAVVRSAGTARRSALLDVARFAGPVAITGLLLGGYNWLRFDSPFEFGQAYVLQGHKGWYDYYKGSHTHLHVGNLAFTLSFFLLAIPAIDTLKGGFPFFEFGGVFHPNGVLVERPMISIFLLVPVAALTAFVPLLLAQRSLAAPVQKLAVSVLLGMLTTLLIISAFPGVSLRYTMDVLPAFTLLGSLVLLGWTASYGRAAVRLMTLIGAVGAWNVSVIIGLMLMLNIWQSTYPERVEDIVMITSQLLAHLSTTLFDMF